MYEEGSHKTMYTYGMDGRVAQKTTALVDEVIPKNISESNKLTEVLQNGIIKKITTATGGNGANIYTDIAVNHVGKLYYHNGYLGSANYLTEVKGNIRAVTTSDEWGNVREGSNNDINIAGLDRTFGYTSYTYDKVLDLSFAQRRFYDGGDRRFISQDPVKDGVNWYRYCEGNPVRFVDPWGEDARSYVIGTGNFTGNFIKKEGVKDKKVEFKLDETRGVLAEYNYRRIIGFWKMVAKVKQTTKVGKGDIVFTRMNLDKSTVDVKKYGDLDPKVYDYNSKFMGDYANYADKEDNVIATVRYEHSHLPTFATANEGKNLDMSEFLYYRAGIDTVITEYSWKNKIHCNERYYANEDYSLPSKKSYTKDEGFKQLPKIAAQYHGSDYGNLKYINENGREAIYINLNPSKYTNITNDGYGEGGDNDYKLAKLRYYPQIGPTFNYAYSDSLGETFNAHYYLDMLPYYKWGTLLP